MEYTFLNMSDEELLAGADMPLEGGVSLALLTTGYNGEIDEAVSVSLADINGAVSFSHKVKPHNLEEWQASVASGGIGPEDVAECQAFYEYEDELMELLEKSKFIVGQHLDFMKTMLDRSWISLPNRESFDVCELFRLSHASADYPNEPATVATLEGIAGYYGIQAELTTSDGVAQAVAACYKALVNEFIERRDAKGEDYWEARRRRLEAENAPQEQAKRVAEIRNRRMNQMNSLLWVAAGLIFTSLAINMYQGGYDFGLIIVASAAAAFMYIRAIVNWRKK